VTSDIRDKDCACRWGGEEILILLRTSRDTAVSVAERICRDISKCVINCGEDSISVTVTLGVAQLRDDDTMDTFVARADECLYKGKNSGKNQVVSDIGMH
jgi:diguanylate cyclase (GGDEF)-like protein